MIETLSLSLTTPSGNSGHIRVRVVQCVQSVSLSRTHAHTHTHSLSFSFSLSSPRHTQAIAGKFVYVPFNVCNFLLPHWSSIRLLHVHTHTLSLSLSQHAQTIAGILVFVSFNMTLLSLSRSHTHIHTHTHTLSLSLTTPSGNSGHICACVIQRVQLPVAALVIHLSSTRTHTLFLPLLRHTQALSGIIVYMLFNMCNFVLPNWSFICLLWMEVLASCILPFIALADIR